LPLLLLLRTRPHLLPKVSLAMQCILPTDPELVYGQAQRHDVSEWKLSRQKAAAQGRRGIPEKPPTNPVRLLPVCIVQPAWCRRLKGFRPLRASPVLPSLCSLGTEPAVYCKEFRVLVFNTRKNVLTPFRTGPAFFFKSQRGFTCLERTT